MTKTGVFICSRRGFAPTSVLKGVRSCRVASLYTPPAVCHFLVGRSVDGCSLSSLRCYAATKRTLGCSMCRAFGGVANVHLVRNFKRARAALALNAFP